MSEDHSDVEMTKLEDQDVDEMEEEKLDPGLGDTQPIVAKSDEGADEDSMMLELQQTPRGLDRDVQGVVTVDEWLTCAGGFGKFQYRQTFLVGVIVYGIAPAFWVVQPVFLNPKIQDEFGVSKSMMNMTSALTFAGWAIGAFIFTRLADKHGRKPIIFITTGATTVISLLSAMSPVFAVYAMCRFFLGGCVGGMGATAYILMIEFLTPEGRGPATNVTNACFALGTCMLAVVALMLKDVSWRAEIVFNCIPGFIFLCCWKIVYESPRWLCVVGQEQKAEMVLGVVARLNGAVMDSSISLERSPQDPVLSPRHSSSQPKPKEKKDGFVQTVQRIMRPSLRSQAIALFFCWFSVTFVYYGLSFAAGSMPGSVYSNTILLALVELPAYGICYITVEVPSVGRKKTQAGGFITAGIALILIMLLSTAGAPESATTVLALLGKLGASGAFLTVYILAGEVFPTSVRGAGLGMCNVFARIGGVLGPLAPSFGPMAFVFLMFGAFAFTAGVLSLLYLSETLGKPLQDVMDEDLPESIEQASEGAL